MPWNPSDAPRFTKKAKSPAAKKQFAAVANKVLDESGDEGKAIKTASGVVAKRGKSGSKPPNKRTVLRAGLRGTY